MNDNKDRMYDTLEVCTYIKHWILSNSDIVRVTALSIRAGLNRKKLGMLLYGEQRTLSDLDTENLLGVLYQFGFTLPDRMVKFERIICEEVSILTNENVTPDMLPLKNRKREIVYARNICMLFRNSILKHSLSASAEPYGLNHTTVLNSKKTIKNLYEYDKNFRETIKKIEKRTCKTLI